VGGRDASPACVLEACNALQRLCGELLVGEDVGAVRSLEYVLGLHVGCVERTRPVPRCLAGVVRRVCAGMQALRVFCV